MSTIPVRARGDSPITVVRDDFVLLRGHPMFDTPCPVCDLALGDGTPCALVLVGFHPSDYKGAGWQTGAAVGVHTRCTGPHYRSTLEVKKKHPRKVG